MKEIEVFRTGAYPRYIAGHIFTKLKWMMHLLINIIYTVLNRIED